MSALLQKNREQFYGESGRRSRVARMSAAKSGKFRGEDPDVASLIRATHYANIKSVRSQNFRLWHKADLARRSLFCPLLGQSGHRTKLPRALIRRERPDADIGRLKIAQRSIPRCAILFNSGSTGASGMMKRREVLVTLLGGAAVAWPLAARAQQAGRVPRIGVVYPGPQAGAPPRVQAVLDGLRAAGYSQVEIAGRRRRSFADYSTGNGSQRFRSRCVIRHRSGSRASGAVGHSDPSDRRNRSRIGPGGRRLGRQPRASRWKYHGRIHGLPGFCRQMVRAVERHVPPALSRRRSMDRQGARPQCLRQSAHARRRGDRIARLFAAAHESVLGTKRT
jgi:hypothetical protein